MKKHLIILVQLVLAAAITTPVQACGCFPYEPVFCRIVDEGYTIVRGVATDFPAFYLMEIRVLDKLHQPTYADTVYVGDNLLIYGNDGATCGQELSIFGINDTLILALFETERNGIDYWFLDGACGLHYLRYANGLVTGQITDSLTVQSIQGFNDSLFDCLALTVPVGEVNQLDKSVTLSPNPVSDYFQISTSGIQLKGYEIYTASGRQLEHKEIAQPVFSIDIPSDDLQSGIYYIKIHTTNGILTRKFVKM